MSTDVRSPYSIARALHPSIHHDSGRDCEALPIQPKVLNNQAQGSVVEGSVVEGSVVEGSVVEGSVVEDHLEQIDSGPGILREKSTGVRSPYSMNNSGYRDPIRPKVHPTSPMHLDDCIGKAQTNPGHCVD